MDLQLIEFDSRFDYCIFALACSGDVPLLMSVADRINERLLEDADKEEALEHPAVLFVTDENGVDGKIRYFREDRDDVLRSLRTLSRLTEKGLISTNLVCVDGAWDIGYESVFDVLVDLQVHGKLEFSKIPDIAATFKTNTGKSVLFCWTFPQ